MASQIASAMTGIGLQNLGKAIGNGLSEFGNYTAKAADRANGISFASQNAQGAFNQGSANIANDLGSQRIMEQMGYNSAAWDRAAGWNEMMFERQMAFNAEEAQKQRDWMQMMESTKYQRAIKDMETAGLNPILAVTGGGVSVGSGGGSAASVGAPTMGATSSGLLNGISASEGNFQGQMEYMSGMLGLISAAIGGFSSAFKNLGSLGDFGEGLGQAILSFLTQDSKDTNIKTVPNIVAEKTGEAVQKFSNTNPFAKATAQGWRDNVKRGHSTWWGVPKK